jgi:hypothetical protein
MTRDELLRALEAWDSVVSSRLHELAFQRAEVLSVRRGLSMGVMSVERALLHLQEADVCLGSGV